jgi:beta-galactosidase
MWCILFGFAWLPSSAAASAGGRLTIPLDGIWEVDESVAAEDLPKVFRHSGPVPGLANLARPAFPDVDRFDSRESMHHPHVKNPNATKEALEAPVGIARQNRNYFWYRTTFRPPERKQVAILKINQAQFGAAVWLNGRKIGEHLGCFSAGYFDVTQAMNWGGENRLIVRIGAHPGALPVWAPAGTDLEKFQWTPGIYDSVSLLLSENPVIETVQVAPRIRGPEIVVQTVIRNYGETPVAFGLAQRVRTWKDGRRVAESSMPALRLGAGERKTWTQIVRIPSATLWSPENPFLYQLDTSTAGDDVRTRFGMREFRFDTATQRAYLNGQVCFLRGSNVTLHRFFEDPKCGALPWQEQWARKLLGEIPKRMHWNSFRFCIGPVPDRWLDIADEAGLLIQNEFPIWTYHKQWDTGEVIRQFGEWMRDNWNHPSVVLWDSNNETVEPLLAEQIIPSVRSLDLSNRPWENGWNPPQGPDDPVEHHPYLAGGAFRLTDLERMYGASRDPWAARGHAAIINEYEWLWLNRDGSPTTLTKGIYDAMLGPGATAEARFDEYAYRLAGITEFWRAYRNFAGIMYFTFLTASFPGAFTSDNFRNVETLELEPHFEDYMSEASKPLGVYLNFWQPTQPAGSEQTFKVLVINDERDPVNGSLALVLETAAREAVARSEAPLYLPPNGQQTFLMSLRFPGTTGSYVLKAVAQAEGNGHSQPTISRRRVSVVSTAEAAESVNRTTE